MVTLAQYESLPRYQKAITPYPEEYITMTEKERKEALNNSIIKDNKQTLTAPQVFKSVQLKNNVNYRTPTAQEKNILKINGINPDVAFLKTNTTAIKTPTKTPPIKKTTTTKRTTPSVQAPKADTTQFGVAPEGWTQDEWNQSMAMYKADSEHYYDTQRNKPVGNGKTQDQVFGELFNQYTTNPTSFNNAQAEQLLELSKKLGYAYGYKTGNPEAHKQWEAGYTSDGIQAPNVNNVTPTQQTQTTVQRTVSESPTVSINDQARKGFKTNDTTGYYSGQNPGIRNLYL